MTTVSKQNGSAMVRRLHSGVWLLGSADRPRERQMNAFNVALCFLAALSASHRSTALLSHVFVVPSYQTDVATFGNRVAAHVSFVKRPAMQLPGTLYLWVDNRPGGPIAALIRNRTESAGMVYIENLDAPRPSSASSIRPNDQQALDGKVRHSCAIAAIVAAAADAATTTATTAATAAVTTAASRPTASRPLPTPRPRPRTMTTVP